MKIQLYYIPRLYSQYLDVGNNPQEAHYNEHVDQMGHLIQREQSFLGRVPATQSASLMHYSIMSPVVWFFKDDSANH